MKTITGILVTCALVIPASPAAAQGDIQDQVERIVSSALTIAADALDSVVEDRADRAARQRGGPGRDDRGPAYTEKFEKTVRLGRNGRLELLSYSGDVEIVGGSGEDVKVTATKSTHSGNEQAARAALSAMAIEINERPGAVAIQAKPTSGRSNSVEVNYVISVPAGTSLDLKTYSGDVTIRSMSGDIRLKSYSGDVVVREGKPASIDLDSVSGDVSLEQIDSERVKVNSLSGDVVFKGKLSKTGRYDLSTNSGDVQVVTDGGASFEVEARTFSGDVTSDFPLKLGGNFSSQLSGNNSRGARRNNDIRGIANDGGALLTLHSFSGDILISKR
jgi:DUF4097 and DUF4098 domain-containing protein YvlB